MEEVNGKLGESPLFDDVGEDLVQGPFTFMGKGKISPVNSTD